MFIKLSNKREKQIYKNGKIFGYYKGKDAVKKQCKKEKKVKRRYGDFNPGEAMKAALKRSHSNFYN